MLGRWLLMLFVCVSSTVIFSGSCGSKPAGRKQNTIVPERRKKITVDVGLFGDALGAPSGCEFFMISPGGSMPAGSAARHSSASTEASALSTPHVPIEPRAREEVYVKSWLSCRELFAELYECFRQVHVNFRRRLDVEGQALENLIKRTHWEGLWRKTLEEYHEVTEEKFGQWVALIKQNNTLISFARHLFFVDIKNLSYSYGDDEVVLSYFALQICPTCKKDLPAGSYMRMCYCGGNLILPHNYQELENALGSVYRYLALFRPKVQKFNIDLRRESGDKR